VERDEERPLEGRDSGTRIGDPRRLGRSAVRADGGARRPRPEATHAPLGGVTPRWPHRYTVLAIDRKTGKTIWERVAGEDTPHEATRADNGTWASSSAVTDGEHVIASPESGGLYA
jgi:outer membrane protein assembly factor BamB